MRMHGARGHDHEPQLLATSVLARTNAAETFLPLHGGNPASRL